MTALVADSDERSRRILSTLLLESGYERTLEARSAENALDLLEENAAQIRLVIASWEVGGGADFPLSRSLTNNPSLHLAPLVLVFQERSTAAQFRVQSPLSRVDAELLKPFGARALKQALITAHRRRATLRSTLLLLGSRQSLSLGEAVWTSSERTIWSQVLATNRFDELDRIIEEEGFRVGTLLVDPRDFNSSDWSWLPRFKKTRLGSVTPVVCLSRSPEETAPLRSHADWFVVPPRIADPGGWEEVLVQLSRRVTEDYAYREQYANVRHALRKGNFAEAERSLQNARRVDPLRWENDELEADLLSSRGKTADAVQACRRALSGNPCSIRANVALIEMLESSAREEAARTALSFCPAHPRIKMLQTPEAEK